MKDFDEGQQLSNSENEKHLPTVSVRKNLENFPSVVVERYELALEKPVSYTHLTLPTILLV